MFEEEAEDNKPPYAYCSFNTDCELWKDGFQKGAEFGYNKAKEEIKAELLKCYQGYPKESDWDFKIVKENDSCPDCFCEDCTKNCEIKKLGLVEVGK